MPVYHPAFSPQNIHALPSRDVPLVIGRDSRGQSRLRTRNVLGRVKIAVLRSLGRKNVESHDAHNHFCDFLRHNYGDEVAYDAFRQASISTEKPPNRDLTAHQARLALSYAQQSRFKNIQHNRRLAEAILPAPPTTSQHRVALQAMCAEMHPPVDINAFKPEQWLYARKALVRYFNVHSPDAPISEGKAVVLASHIVGQAHALGAEGCAGVVKARGSLNKAMAEFFSARARGDNSDAVGQLLRISQRVDNLRQLETAHAHPAAKAYIDKAYEKGAAGSMTAYLQDNVKSSHDSSRFHHILSSLSRDSFVDVMRSSFQVQKAQRALSQKMIQQMEHVTAMLTHTEQELGVYGAKESVAPSKLPYSHASLYSDVTGQMRVHGGVADIAGPRHQTRVQMAHHALQQAENNMRKGARLPALIAPSAEGRGPEKNSQSLNFMRQALESALENDTNIKEMRRLSAQIVTMQRLSAEERPPNYEDQQKKLFKAIDQLRDKFFQSQSAYTKLYGAMERFATQWSAHNPAPSSLEAKQYQAGLDKMLELYEPSQLLSLPRHSSFQCDEKGQVRFVRAPIRPPENSAQIIQQGITPRANEREWQVDDKKMGVNAQFAADIMRQDIIVDNNGQQENIREWVAQQKQETDSERSKITMAVNKFHEMIGNREDAFFLSHFLNQSLGNQGTAFMMRHVGFADSMLTHTPLGFTNRIKNLSMTVHKVPEGGYTIDYQGRFETPHFMDGLGGSEMLHVSPESGWWLTYRIAMSSEDLANKTFQVGHPHVGGSIVIE
ncbi:MAG: hypothetical protein GDA50_06740 [Alphaproteobacteria bacterium GM202ARS2]|nr:hypothetical protein [Alphaproteobacteria bacterium GM202ARS2]